MYAYYVEVPRILISGSNFQFIHPVEFLENFQFFCISTFCTHGTLVTICAKQKRSTEGCSKFKSPETRQVQERLVSTLEHMQVPKWDRTRCPEE